MSTAVFFVGIDLGNDKHAICVLDSQRRTVLKSRIVENDLRLVDVLLGAVGDTKPADVHVALEDRNNVVVDELLARGFSVFTVNPKQLDRFRERETVAGAKDDRRDASVAAHALATDAKLFQLVRQESPHQVQMAGLSSTLVTLDDEHRVLANQLRAVVLRVFPALLSLCEGADEPWFWALLRCLGKVDDAKRVRTAALEKLLSAHRKRAVKAADIEAVIARRHLTPAAGVRAASRDQATSLIERLVLVEQQRTTTTKTRERLLAELAQPVDGKPSDVAILLSLPGIGTANAATLFSECRTLLNEGNLERLRAMSGVAPVTKQSGKRKQVVMRYACRADLRNVFFHAAHAASRTGRFKAKYESQKAMGHDHPRALRAVGDQLLHVLVAMFKSRSLFDESVGA